MKKIVKAIQELESSPLFYLFMSSKELFHSNFWYWLSIIDNKNNETIKLFSQKNIKTPKFEREKRKTTKDKSKAIIDLLILENNNPKVVIENKVKDFPTLNQLDLIRESFEFNKDIEYVLVSLFPINNLDIKSSGWNVLSYMDLSNAIDPTKFTDNTYYISLIEDYKNFTYKLSEFANLLPCNSNYDFAIEFSKDLFSVLNRIKFWEGYQKMRASDMIIKFENLYSGINTSYSINNQKATINFSFKIENIELGIQIENNQFRKYINSDNAIKIANELIKNEIFFQERLNLERKNKDFLKYGNNWRYQYEKIGQIIDYSTLFDKIKIELEIFKTRKNEIIQIIKNFN